MIDLVVIGGTKVVFRRQRPVYRNNKVLLVQAPGDQFSFPSGKLIFFSQT